MFNINEPEKTTNKGIATVLISIFLMAIALAVVAYVIPAKSAI